MQRKFKRLTFVVFLVLFSAVVSPLKADVKDSYCYLEATVDVNVEVWDQDQRGNKRRLIWKGLIRKNKRQLIRARYGQIRYASTVSIDKNDPLSGDRRRWCEDGQTIGVP
jgi:hypothetical protein